MIIDWFLLSMLLNPFHSSPEIICIFHAVDFVLFCFVFWFSLWAFLFVCAFCSYVIIAPMLNNLFMYPVCLCTRFFTSLVCAHAIIMYFFCIAFYSSIDPVKGRGLDEKKAYCCLSTTLENKEFYLILSSLSLSLSLSLSHTHTHTHTHT